MEGHHTTVLALIATPNCPLAYHCCFVFKTLSLSLYLEITVYKTEKRGDLCICTYQIWQIMVEWLKKDMIETKMPLKYPQMRGSEEMFFWPSRDQGYLGLGVILTVKGSGTVEVDM